MFSKDEEEAALMLAFNWEQLNLSIDQSDILLRLLYRIVYKSSSELRCQKCNTCNDSLYTRYAEWSFAMYKADVWVNLSSRSTLTKRARCAPRVALRAEEIPLNAHSVWPGCAGKKAKYLLQVYSH